MTKTLPEYLSQDIVTVILHDLTDRAGLSDAWDVIDEDIRNEILDEWCRLVLAQLNKA